MAHMDSNHKGQFPIVCQLCESELKIKWKCIDCNILMCINCHDNIHPKFKDARKHKIVDLKEIGLQNSDDDKCLDFTNISCKTHADQVCCLFCQTCNILICPTCTSKTHTKHEMVEIKEAYKIKLEQLKTSKSHVQKDRESLNTREAWLNHIKSREQLQHNKITKEILDQNAAVKKKADMCTDEIMAKLDKRLHSIKCSTKGCIYQINMFKQQLDIKLNKSDNIATTTNISEFFEVVDEHINGLDEILPSINPTIKTMPEFIPGEITHCSLGCLSQVSRPSSYPVTMKLTLIRKFDTDIPNIQVICAMLDNSFWISNPKLDLLQRLKPKENKLILLSGFQKKVYGIATINSDAVLLSTGDEELEMLNIVSGNHTNSNYKVPQYASRFIHVTRDNKVTACAYGTDQTGLAETVVIVMDTDGNHEKVYKNDNNNKPLFTSPSCLTSTVTGNICVLDDSMDDNIDDKVIVLGQEDFINIYSGKPDINTNTFKTWGATSTPLDYILVADIGNHILHLLNNTGYFITYYKTSDIGINCPITSLAFNAIGRLYIGCKALEDSEEKPQLYETDYSEN